MPTRRQSWNQASYLDGHLRGNTDLNGKQMGQETDIEIYRQRYETFRHLDKLRWQMLQILVAVGSAAALTLRTTPSSLEWWFVGAVGIILLLISSVMFRIGAGIQANCEVLHEVGQRIGDNWLPDLSKRWRARSFWISTMVMCAGLLCLVYALLLII